MELPSGRVTFLFTDIEGSTGLGLRLAPDTFASLIERHHALLGRAIHDHGGVIVKLEGDAVFAAFPEASTAVQTAVRGQQLLAAEPWPGDVSLAVRMGLHTGLGRVIATPAGPDYASSDVNLAARVCDAANGRQIVISEATRAGLDGLVAVDLVEHAGIWLRGVDVPWTLYRVDVPGAADDRRPLRGRAPVVERRAAALPEPLTSFVGREDEVDDLAATVRTKRVVTLTGPGGTGKTRLALAAASRAEASFPDGVQFVDLAPIIDPDLLVPALGSALGLVEEPDRPMIAALRDHLAPRRLLLLLDNVEQVVAGVGVLTGLLQGAPGVHVLATSRERLRIGGETEVRVPPLRRTDAVALFLDRMRLVRPDYTPDAAGLDAIERIAERVDDLPLAIELTAARTRVMAPDGILARLDRGLDALGGGSRDLPARHRTLRAAIAWSYELLPPLEQRLFRRLAPFSGGWTVEAAYAVADADGDLELDVLDGLESLVDKSLVNREPTEHGDSRFSRLPTIREFAQDELAASGELARIEEAHARWLLGLVERAEPELEAGDPVPWDDLLDHEQHNLRSALEWSLRSGEVEIGLRIVGAGWRYWHHRSLLREGSEWSRRLLDHPAAAGSSPARFRALNASGGLAYWRADWAAAEGCYEEARQVATELGDRALIAEAEYSIGFIAIVNGDPVRQIEHHERAYALFGELGDGPGAAKVRQALVVGEMLRGRFPEAARLAVEDVAYQAGLGARFREADSETLAAAALVQAGDSSGAGAHICRALHLYAELEVETSTLGALVVAALVASSQGRPDVTARLVGGTRAMRDELGSTIASLDILHLPDPEVPAREALGSDRFDALLAEGRTMGRAALVDLAIATVNS